MKRYIIMLFAAALSFASCDIQLDDVFDKNPSERIDILVEDVYKQLTAAPNGWVMEYYPEASQKWGGVNILVKFNADKTVEMLNQDLGTDILESTYTVNRTQNATLAFDTYNRYIHYYADPEPDPSNINLGDGRRYGFKGDFDFAVKNMSDNEIELKGTKTGNRIILRKMPAETTWTDYITGINTMKRDNFFFVRYFVNYDDKEQELNRDATYNRLTWIEKESGINAAASFIYTADGIKLYEPLEMLGATMQNFRWEKATGRYLCTDAGFESAYLQGKETDYFRPYEWFLGTWEFHGASTTGVDQVMTLTVTEKEFEKSFYVSGLKTTASFAIGDQTFVMGWAPTGQVSIIAQSLGLQTVTYSGAQYPDKDIWLRSSSATSYGTSNSAGMCSSTTLHENPNRVDLVNNGAYANGIGLRVIIPAGIPAASNGWRTGGGPWVMPMYMLKKE